MHKPDSGRQGLGAVLPKAVSTSVVESHFSPESSHHSLRLHPPERSSGPEAPAQLSPCAALHCFCSPAQHAARWRKLLHCRGADTLWFSCAPKVHSVSFFPYIYLFERVTHTCIHTSQYKYGGQFSPLSAKAWWEASLHTEPPCWHL